MNHHGIDLHKRESQVAIVERDGGIQREVRVLNANLDTLAEEYAGNEAAIEATGITLPSTTRLTSTSHPLLFAR